LKLGSAGLAGAFMLGATSCGGGGRRGSGPAEVVFSFGPDPSGTLQGVVDRFNRQSQDVRVTLREMPADTAQYFDRVRTELQAGGGDIDVIGGDVIWPAQFAANGWILDLSDRFPPEERGRFLEAPIESNVYEGGIYGVPWFTDAGMLFYRRDLLERAGISSPPKTWKELKEQARRVQEQTGTEYGFVFQGVKSESVVSNTLEYIWSYGGDVLEEGTSDRVIIDSPKSVEGLATERSMIKDGVAPRAVVNYEFQDTHSVFLAGDAVFARNWPYMYALAGDPEQSKIKQEQVGLAPLPAGDTPEGQSFSTLGGWNFFINAASEPEIQDAAYKFIQFATAPEQQRYRAVEGGFLPTLKSLYEDPTVSEKVPVVAQGKEAIRSTRPRPVSPYYSDMSLRMAEQFNAALDGQVSPEQAIKTLQGELSEIVEQAG
jgi:multiple sugar transport system substrate-binding protein